MKSNNPPYKVVELTKEQYEFLLDNCDTNISMGLEALPAMQSNESIQRIVDLIEQFKSVKKALKDAG